MCVPGSTHFSFTPPDPFLATARLPWSKLHDEAASVAPAAKSRNAEPNVLEKRIVGDASSADLKAQELAE